MPAREKDALELAPDPDPSASHRETMEGERRGGRAARDPAAHHAKDGQVRQAGLGTP